MMDASLWFASREACEAVAGLAYLDAVRATAEDGRKQAPPATETDGTRPAGTDS